MSKSIQSTISVFCLSVILAACGGDSGKSSDANKPVISDDQETVNTPPVISPIANQSILFGETVTLSATVTDDGLPDGTLTSLWRFVSGPDNTGAPTFNKRDALDVLVSFSAPGVYQFSINVDDGEYSAQSSMQVDVQAIETTAFNSGLEISLPANYLPSHSYDAEWINRIWNGVSDCMSSDRARDKISAERRRSQLSHINIYKEQDYDPQLHDNTGDPNTWTSISAVAEGVIPDNVDVQGAELAEKMVDYLLLFGSRPVDGSLICGYNHAGRRHAIDTITPSVEPHITTQNLLIDGINVVVQARELKAATMNQLVQIAEYLTRIENSDEHTPLNEIRIVEDVKSVASIELGSARGGFSVNESMLVLRRDLLEDDLFTAPNYLYPGNWIDSYRQAYEDYYWDEEHQAVYDMTCCLPLK